MSGFRSEILLGYHVSGSGSNGVFLDDDRRKCSGNCDRNPCTVYQSSDAPDADYLPDCSPRGNLDGRNPDDYDSDSGSASGSQAGRDRCSVLRSSIYSDDGSRTLNSSGWNRVEHSVQCRKN